MAMKKGTKQILLIGGLGVGGYLAYRWWQGRQAAGAEAAAYYPSGYGAGGGFGGGMGSILWGAGGVDSGPCNDGTPEEVPTFSETGEQITATGQTPTGSNYRILDSGKTEIFNPYVNIWEPIAYPGPAVVKVPGAAPYGELSAELIRQIQYQTTGIPARGLGVTPGVTPAGAPSFEPAVPAGTIGGLPITGTTPMGTAYQLESLKAGAPAYVYNPYTGAFPGLGAWEKIAHPGPAVVKQPGLQPYGEPSAQAARAASAARAAVQRVTEAAKVGAARAAAGQIAYPTFAPSTAAQVLQARVPMAGGGHL